MEDGKELIVGIKGINRFQKLLREQISKNLKEARKIDVNFDPLGQIDNNIKHTLDQGGTIMTTDTTRQYNDYTGNGIRVNTANITAGTLFLRGLLDTTAKPILHQNSIKGVWFNRNKGVTVVRWNDDTITKVKCHNGDKFNPEHGLAMCISKKAFGNKGNYNDVFKKWLPEKEK